MGLQPQKPKYTVLKYSVPGVLWSPSNFYIILPRYWGHNFSLLPHFQKAYLQICTLGGYHPTTDLFV